MKNKTKGYITAILAGLSLEGSPYYGLVLFWVILSWYYYKKALQDRYLSKQHRLKHNKYETP